MKLLNHYISEIVIKVVSFSGIIIALAMCLYFFSRLYNLTSIPIFTDEAIYLRWAQIAKNDAAWRFISLTDGKQPLFIWFIMVSLRFFDDPLVAGRIVSVAAGFLSMVGMYVLGREIFKNHWTGLISLTLYVLYPFALVYDRMALYDSLVGAIAIWSLYLSILLIRRIRLDIALILGMIIGAGVLTKTNAFFNVYLLPLTLILFDFRKGEKTKYLFKWIMYATIAALLAYGYYSILRLSPFFNIITEKNALFVYPIKEWVEHPLRFLWGNLYIGEKDWLLKYMTWPYILLVAMSFIIDKKFLREKILLFFWFFTPFFLLALFGKVIYPRFIFFMTLSLLPLISYTLYKVFFLFPRKYALFFFVAVHILVIRSDYFILVDFKNAPIPSQDLRQYNNDWPSGGGIREAVSIFQSLAKKEKIFVGTQGTFGLLPYAFEIYLINNPNIEVKGFWPINETVPQELIEGSKKKPTYFVFYQPCNVCEQIGRAPSSWNAKLIFEFEKPHRNGYFTIYEIEK